MFVVVPELAADLRHSMLLPSQALTMKPLASLALAFPAGFENVCEV